MDGSSSQRGMTPPCGSSLVVTAFFSPMAFNETLAEDHTVNRLADSLDLWRMICSDPLLASVDFILFLNKVDIFTRKIQSGVRFSEHFTSYQNKPNEPKEIIKYLADKFAEIHRKYSPRLRKMRIRKMHLHLTCAIDMKATATVIEALRDIIYHKALKSLNVLA
ncbi:guanine nucleotide binding protein, alpha subunit [Mycena vulgaris]|nr:guanine nucleotide binding protein, alpha subunit [Mycena vulgaris]